MNSRVLRRVITSFSNLEGPLFHFPAALSFFRALRVYPSPPELIGIYQQTVPPPVFALIMQLMQHEVSSTSRKASVAGDSIDDDEIDAGVAGSAAPRSASGSRSASRTGPPSETSSREWDNVTDPGLQTPADA